MERNRPAEQELERAVGVRWEYYIQAWSTLEQDGRGLAGWNWAAFLLPAGWGVYRRLYGLAAVMLAFTALSQYAAAKHPDLFFLPLTLLLCNLSVRLYVGVYANNWYYRSCCKKIARAPRTAERKRLPRDAGGPNRLGWAVAAASVLWYAGRAALSVLRLVESLR